MSRLGLVHAHTRHSFDSLLPVRAYLAYARRRRLDFLCITDHNTIAGSLDAARQNRDPRLQVVVGAEYATERGDVIGLFLHDEIRHRRWTDVVAAIRDQGGLVVLPHPARHGAPDEAVWGEADLVEVFNARSRPWSNEAARREAEARGLPQLAGADTHTLWELARGPSLVSVEGDGDLREALRSGERSFVTRPSARALTWYSQAVKAVRARIPLPGR